MEEEQGEAEDAAGRRERQPACEAPGWHAPSRGVSPVVPPLPGIDGGGEQPGSVPASIPWRQSRRPLSASESLSNRFVKRPRLRGHGHPAAKAPPLSSSVSVHHLCRVGACRSGHETHHLMAHGWVSQNCSAPWFAAPGGFPLPLHRSVGREACEDGRDSMGHQPPQGSRPTPTRDGRSGPQNEEQTSHRGRDRSLIRPHQTSSAPRPPLTACKRTGGALGGTNGGDGECRSSLCL